MEANVTARADFPARHAARVFDSPDSPADPSLLAMLEAELKDADLAAPPVVLPDFYLADHMEVPSSIAVATCETIRPRLTHPSLNCGMGLVALDIERPHQAAISTFYQLVRERYPYPQSLRRELSKNDVVRCAIEGASFSVDRFDLDPTELHHVEEGGRLKLDSYGGVQRVRRELPWLAVQASRVRFGGIGPSNHFVELQEVEEIFDAMVAARLGIHLGQVTLQYHTGDQGLLNMQIGALFGKRMAAVDTGPRFRALMAVQKPLYHLASARSLAELRRRWWLYFSNGCPPVPRYGREGERLMLAIAVAMNYGFAYRLATYASLRDVIRWAFGASSRLVVDSPHNSLYEEDVVGQLALVHRFNASRAYPASRLTDHPNFRHIGQPLLLPGTHRTSSYLCVASEGAAQSLYSVCHGTGTIIDDFGNRGLSGPDPGGHTTLRFRYSDAGPSTVPHLDDRGVNEGLGILVRHDLVRPVAKLRPFAVLNDPDEGRPPSS